MLRMSFAAWATLALSGAALFAGRAIAGDEVVPARFESPVLVRSGDGSVGSGRLYPSPVWHDLDRDGRAEIIVGDLRGILTVSKRIGDDEWSKPEELKNADGKPLKFSNW